MLAPAKDLVFNDAPWVPDQRARFVHARLSHQVLSGLFETRPRSVLSSKLEPTEVAALFADLLPQHAACKFRGCSHPCWPVWLGLVRDQLAWLGWNNDQPA